MARKTVSGDIVIFRHHPLSSSRNSQGEYDIGGRIKTNETDNINRPESPYLKQALGHRLLTAQEETELGNRALSGDIEARNTLMLLNQRFLLKTVGEFHAKHPSLEYDDLVSEANLGLLRAAEKYDPSTRNRFVTYARFWILQALTRFAEQQTLPVRLPENKAEVLKKIRFAIQETGSTDYTTLSHKIGIESETVKRLLPYVSGTISLDSKARTPDGNEGESLRDLLLSVEEDFLKPICNSELLGVLEKLPERQREILMHRYGAFGRRKMTLQEVADLYGVTRERIRQIEKQALTACRRIGNHIA